MIKRWFFLTLGLIVSCGVLATAVFAEEVGKRSCFGLIWCTEEKDGSKATDALFSLYALEERGSFSRLAVRPFYSHEIDPSKGYVRRSVLWPLGTYEQKGDDLSFHVFPLYWHDREANQRFTLIPPIYLNYVKEERSYSQLLLYGELESPTLNRRFFFPLYGSEEVKEQQDHRFSLLGLPPISGLDPFPTLSLYEHRTSPDLVTDRLFPIYRYAHHSRDQKTDLSVLLLYRHSSAPHRTTDRLFPLYRYENDMEEQHLRFSLIGSRALSLFWYDVDPGLTENHLFPLYSYKGGPKRGDSRFGILGYDALSLYHHRSAPAAITDRLFPLYDYQVAGEGRSLSLIGFSDFALYRQVTTPTLIRHRLFPVYGYRDDQIKGEREWDFLLYRHLSSPTGSSDRLFPLYNYESNLGKEAWQIGILGFSPLSVYYHESTPSLTVDRLFPLYGYRNFGSGGYHFSMLGFLPTGNQVTLSLYEHTKSPIITSDRFFPLYSYFRNHETGALRWDILLYYQHQKTPTYTKDVFLPFHHYENDLAQERWQLRLIGIPPLTLFRQQESKDATDGYLFPLYSFKNNRATDALKIGVLGYDGFSLYRHKSDPNGVSDHLFPIYGYRKNGAERRFTFLGLPPIDGSSALSLYEHRSAVDQVTDRFFPVYFYHRDDRADETNFNLLLLYNHRVASGQVDDFFFPLYSFGRDVAQIEFSIIGYKEFSLLRYASTPLRLNHHFFPVYRYDHNRSEDKTLISALLLYQHQSTPTSAKDRLFPLYDYKREKAAWSLSLMGISDLAFYRHESGPTRITDRLFPLYNYRRNKEQEETRLNALLLFKYQEGHSRKEHRFFPLYSYKNDNVKGEQRFGLFGVAPISLYQHLSTAQKTSDRFFPLYHYTVDRTVGEGEFSLLWPLFNYKSRNGKTTEASLLWWLVNYERKEEGHKAFRVLGGSAMAVFRTKRTPEYFLVEFNPIIPFYSYESEKGKGSAWNLLGGLLGRRTQGEEKKTRAFWVYF